MTMRLVLLALCAGGFLVCHVHAQTEHGAELSLLEMLARTHSGRIVTAAISKVLRCLEKSIQPMVKILSQTTNTISNCTPKFPSEFIQCLMKSEVPRSVADLSQHVADTMKCVTTTSS